MSITVSRPLSAAVLSEEAAAFRSDLYRDAVAAGAALMVHADGEAAPAERRRLLDLMRDEPSLAHLSREEVVEMLATHEANYRLDPEVAMEIAYERLDAIKGRGRLGSAVVAVCRALIPADGVAHPSEFRTLAEIRARLGLAARPVPLAGFGATARPGEGPAVA